MIAYEHVLKLLCVVDLCGRPDAQAEYTAETLQFWQEYGGIHNLYTLVTASAYDIFSIVCTSAVVQYMGVYNILMKYATAICDKWTAANKFKSTSCQLKL